MAANPFKVIVIGGGPVGLLAAHALYKAGMDFVVLERSNEIAVDVGASLVLGPGSLRVLHQLGLLDKLRGLYEQLNQRRCFTVEGYEFKSGNQFKNEWENHGTGPCAFHRAELVQSLYDQLPEEAKSKVLTGKKVTDVQSNETKVKVSCEDGSVYEGDLVLGADGVHSKTRQIMRKLALEENPNADWDPDMPYTSSYRCLWASFKRVSAAGMACETQHKDSSIMYVNGKERGWIFLYEKLPEPTKERTFYTEQDIQAMADRFADYPLDETFKVKDVLADSITRGMSDLQEGICNNWGWGRIVLAGDSIHKACPNAGLGYQNGIQDVVSLINNLRQLVVSSGPSNSPSVSALEAMYETYRKQRWEPLGKDAATSAHFTRMQAWANIWYYLAARYILVPAWIDYVLANVLQAPFARKALAFNFLDADEPFGGRVSWLNPLKNTS